MPSASLVISILALIVAASGTAVAASKLIKGDSLIKKHSLSGNRLRSHTLTGKQINLRRLGTVPSAQNASHAGSADNASNLGGQPPSAFDAASNTTRSGVVSAQLNQNATIATFGPFTLTLTCTGTAGTPRATIIASSSEPNSEANGMAPPDAGPLISSVSGSSFNTNEMGGIDFISPNQGQFFGDVMVGVKPPWSSTPCIAMALINKS
jgi:hypothetical protein